MLAARCVGCRKSPKLLEITAVVAFAAIGTWALVEPASDDFLAWYGRGLAAIVLAVVIAVSLAVRPFTEQYARESVPSSTGIPRASTPSNRKISAAWAGAVAVMGVGHLISGVLAANAADYTGGLVSRPGDLILNWLVPGLLIYMTVNYSRRVVAETDEPQPGGRPVIGRHPPLLMPGPHCAPAALPGAGWRGWPPRRCSDRRVHFSVGVRRSAVG